MNTLLAAVVAMWIVCDPNCRQADPYATAVPTVAPTVVPTALPTIAPTAKPTLQPTAAPTQGVYRITSPALNATVVGTVTIQITTTLSANDAWWQSLTVDGVATGITDSGHHLQLIWDSTTVADGNHVLAVTAHQATTNTIMATDTLKVNVANGVSPTAKPTSPPAAGYPLSDAAAATMVVKMPEQRPDNVTPNGHKPTLVQLQAVQPMASWFVGGNNIPKVTGAFTGTTDEILQWGAAKWGFNADLVRAIAVTESHWHQPAMGDIGNGVSLSILQIKSTSWLGTCPGAGGATVPTDPALTAPGCLSHNNTAFGTDYKLAVQRNCVDGYGPEWMAKAIPTGGKAPYVIGQQNDLMGCVGSWFSGTWQNAGSLNYQAEVNGYLATRPWTKPGFLKRKIGSRSVYAGRR